MSCFVRAAENDPKIDWLSSATAFEDWTERERDPDMLRPPLNYEPLRVAHASTWLLTTGWKLHGATISRFETPASKR